jgi:hypothetical protein
MLINANSQALIAAIPPHCPPRALRVGTMLLVGSTSKALHHPAVVPLRASRWIPEIKLVGDRGESRVGRPYGYSRDHCRGQQMDVDPSDAAAEQATITYKCHHFLMWDQAYLVHLLVCGQKLHSPASIADQELAEDQLMPDHLIALE